MVAASYSLFLPIYQFPTPRTAVPRLCWLVLQLSGASSAEIQGVDTRVCA
jgi:hypothetical protein